MTNSHNPSSGISNSIRNIATGMAVIALSGTVASASELTDPTGPELKMYGFTSPLEQADQDASGFISEIEADGFAQDYFTKLDDNADDVVSRSEFVSADINLGLAYWPETFAPKQIARFLSRSFGRFDINADGVVSRDEFAATAARDYGQADLNKDGRISTFEYGIRGIVI